MDKAKSKTKTGLGEELVKAEAAWKLVKFNTLDAKKIPLPRPVDVDKAKVAAETHLHAVGAAASKAALAAAAKNNAALSTTAKKAAADIEKGLLAQSRLIRNITLNDFDSYKNELVQMTADINLAAVKKGLNSAGVFIKKVEADPQRTTFNSGIQDACRHLTVPLGNIGAVNGKPDPKALGKNLEKWADHWAA